MKTPRQVADYIIGLYVHFGGEDYIGEPVSQVEHMCQCASFAEQESGDEEVVLAAFFHDIGHLCEHITTVNYMDEFGVMDHEKLGADFLREHGFAERIAQLVQNHVQAKRYLTYKNEDYYTRLSEASKKTLEFQGGRMSEPEAKAFEADPLFPLHIRLRQWDERAKVENVPLPLLTKFSDMIVRHLDKKKSDVA